jgi:hypothetical protein
MEPAEAVRRYRDTGNLREAVYHFLSRIPFPSLREAGPTSAQSQKWALPDEDKANRFMELVRERLPGVSAAIEGVDQGGHGHYEVTVSGDFADHDLASLAGPLLGTRMDNLPG